jgi:hypothetical protein
MIGGLDCIARSAPEEETEHEASNWRQAESRGNGIALPSVVLGMNVSKCRPRQHRNQKQTTDGQRLSPAIARGKYDESNDEDDQRKMPPYEVVDRCWPVRESRDGKECRDDCKYLLHLCCNLTNIREFPSTGLSASRAKIDVLKHSI